MARRSPGSCRRFLMTVFDLTGRVAVVTGGNGGIGLGMAKGLAAAGAASRRETARNRRARSRS